MLTPSPSAAGDDDGRLSQFSERDYANRDEAGDDDSLHECIDEPWVFIMVEAIRNHPRIWNPSILLSGTSNKLALKNAWIAVQDAVKNDSSVHKTGTVLILWFYCAEIKVLPIMCSSGSFENSMDYD